MNNNTTWSRRQFMAGIAGTGAAILMRPWAGLALSDIDPAVMAIVAATIGIDAHNHIDVPLTTGDVPGPQPDLSNEMKRSGLAAICMTFATDYQRSNKPGEPYERFINGLNAMDQLLQFNGMKRALNLSDIRKAKKENHPTVIQSVEGCHFLEGKIERVATAYERGLRHLGLLHDSDASVPLGDVYTNTPAFGGLTPFGKEVIQACNHSGILIDMAHGSGDAVAAAIKLAHSPILVSHTGLNTQTGSNPKMASMMMPRLISKENAKIIADAGGVIGVWTHLADSPLEYAKNIRAMVEVVGIDHVCIGTDTKLTPPGSRPGLPDNNTKPPANDHRDGPANKPAIDPGEKFSKQRVGERTNTAWLDQQQGFYYVVVDALLKTGFNKEEIGKIGGGNYLRVFDKATSKR